MTKTRNNILLELQKCTGEFPECLKFNDNGSNGHRQHIQCRKCPGFKIIVRKHRSSVGVHLTANWYLDAQNSNFEHTCIPIPTHTGQVETYPPFIVCKQWILLLLMQR